MCPVRYESVTKTAILGTPDCSAILKLHPAKRPRCAGCPAGHGKITARGKTTARGMGGVYGDGRINVKRSIKRCIDRLIEKIDRKTERLRNSIITPFALP